MRFGRRTTRWLAAVAAANVAGGCHQYVPLPAGAPVPAGQVRITLSDLGRVAAAPQLGPRVREIEGRLLSRTDSALVVAVTQATRSDGVEQTFNGDSVSLAASSVEQVGTIRTAKGRSWALAGAILAGAIAVAAGIKGGFGEGGRGTGGTSQPGK